MVYIKSVILRGYTPLSFYTDLQSYRSAVVQICSLLYFCLFQVKYILLLCVADAINHNSNYITFLHFCKSKSYNHKLL